ncbi:MAG: hypothetical protein LQ349_009786, partial [Xanthoria aureola]
VKGLRFDNEKQSEGGEGDGQVRHFLTAEKATILWNQTMERARRPYADMPEEPTQAPDGTGNQDHMDNQIKASVEMLYLSPIGMDRTTMGRAKISPPATLQATVARRPTAPTIAIDLEEKRTGEHSSKLDQDQNKLQLPTASRPVGEDESVEGLVKLERSQKIPREPPNLLEESFIRTDDLDRKDSGIDMSHDERRLQRG